MNLEEYITSINNRYKLGNATEHTFRGDLQQLIESLVPGIRATNEPKRQKCGAPDYILTRKEIPIGFIEAKDIGDPDLDGKKKQGNQEQFDRYKSSLNNIIFTDYLDFHFYRSGQLTAQVAIGKVTTKGIKPLTENFERFSELITGFCTTIDQTIKSPLKLAQLMAAKARLLADVIHRSLTSDEESSENSTLADQMRAFKDILIHDITPHSFADVYAQTIAYGMFAARLHDPSLPNFSRQEAAELIPKSNPFLRKLFGYIAGPDLDDRIKWIVDDLVEIFLACNVAELLQGYGRDTRTEDPIVYFYETFLSEYDPKLRKMRGVWNTPLPVVHFIVRSVDEILKSEFNIPHGFADNSKIKIKRDLNGKKVEEEVHRVQILDPATGTGTFLAEIIKLIHKRFEGQQGVWSNYVEEHLIPRLNGFEILMASYAMAHLKLELLLGETGHRPAKDQRYRVYLTNSLEESHPDTGTLFANWLSAEANEANQIKRDTPVGIIIGNPPYSGESANKGEWIMDLMEDYKKEPGGKEKLNERNPKWINDDYVKFIRYGQYHIEKNGTGILAFINPHGYLDNPTFRGMRWNLLKTYDKIYTLDLHGNSKKKETAPDGSPDVNVFDIQQGVSINFFIKTGNKKPGELAQVFHYDLFGERENKYEFLFNNNIHSVPYKEIPPVSPMYFMVSKNFGLEEEYVKGFSINELFVLNSVGIVTARDSFTVHNSQDELQRTIEQFLTITDESARTKFNLGKDVRDWQVKFARKDLEKYYPSKGYICRISYRPFDDRWTFFTGKSKGFHCYPRNEVMRHFINKENLALTAIRINKENSYSGVFITRYIAEARIGDRFITNIFPLYIYSSLNDHSENTNERTANLKIEIVNKISEILGIPFANFDEIEGKTYTPISIFDYIYAVLHSPKYREIYKVFIKTDFPRIPYPKDKKTFWQLVKLGGQLRQLHLLESQLLENFITQYPVSGGNIVEKVTYDNGSVFINKTQHFAGVPEIAWNFYIGGYQPAQKWLKDRKGKALSFDDITHYQRIIVALTETDRLMHEIDNIPFLE